MHRRFTTYGRKVRKEFVQGLPTLQIVQQSLERDTRSPENGRAPENIWVLADYLIPLRRHFSPRPNSPKSTPTPKIYANYPRAARDRDFFLTWLFYPANMLTNDISCLITAEVRFFDNLTRHSNR